ncbi:MAG: hypothetical protein K6A63_00525 [Acholeplasmatales bacterium]|nr:hypothetical protein [Acholeplasmatales bacterium]
MLKIGIYGFGGVGCAIYHELKDYKDLYILVDEDRKKRYESDGIIINDIKYNPNYITSGIMDIIIIALKNYQLKDSLEALKKFSNKYTVFLPMLNGITAHDVRKDYYPFNRVLYGVINVESNKIGNVCKTSKIINFQFGDEYNYVLRWPLRPLKKILDKYHMNNHIYHNMKRRVWDKWTLNLAINQVSALCNATYMDMSHPLVKEVLFNMVDEIYEVSMYYNIGLTPDDILGLKNMINNFKSDRVTSLTVDFNKGGLNELSSFGETFLELAKKAQIETPVNKTVYNLLAGLDDNKKRK